MRNVLRVVTVALLSAAGVAAVPAPALAGGPVHVGGGGTAAFTDPRFEGLTTQFGIGVTVHADGSATGNFTCVIKGVLALHTMITGGTVNADGSVSLTGVAFVHFAGGDMMMFDATLDVRAGGPGVGEFCLGPPTFPDTDCDHEVVVNGQIMIR
jgi:hypothetical protein